MAFKNNCPHCGTLLELEESWIGIECQCPKCNRNFIVSAPAANVPPPPPVQQPVQYAPSAPPPAPQPPAGQGAPTFNMPYSQPGSAANAAPLAAGGQNKIIICPKCRSQHAVMHCGTYTCSCGTTLELLDSGTIYVSLELPRHSRSYWFMIAGFGALGAIAMGVLIYLAVNEDWLENIF